MYKVSTESRHFMFYNEQLGYLVSIRISEFLLQSVTLDHRLINIKLEKLRSTVQLYVLFSHRNNRNLIKAP